MRLLEFQAKQLFAKYGIPIPKGVLVTSVSEAGSVQTPAVLKAQVAVGGRGKAGGIRLVDTSEESVVGVSDFL